jgi:hypothetical protein
VRGTLADLCRLAGGLLVFLGLALLGVAFLAR